MHFVSLVLCLMDPLCSLVSSLGYLKSIKLLDEWVSCLTMYFLLKKDVKMGHI